MSSDTIPDPVTPARLPPSWVGWLVVADRQQAGIAPNTAGQSYNNCGVESSRQIIQQATGSNISQEALLQQSINGGLASQGAPGPAQMWNSGGTNPAQRAQILTNNGVPAATQAPLSLIHI